MIDETLIEDISETWKYVQFDITHEQMYLSMEKCLKTRIYVEGTTDKDFYRKYLKGKNDENVIKPMNDGKVSSLVNYSVEPKDGYRKVISAVKGNPLSYGIIDADYNKTDKEKKIKKINEDKERIKITDAHSLETMLIKYLKDQQFGDYVKKVIEEINKGQVLSMPPVLFANLKQASLQLCYPLSLIRKKYPTNFNYKKIAEESLFFSEYLDLQYLNDNEITIEPKKDALYTNLINNITTKVNQNELISILSEYEYSEDIAYDICQGHNLMNFIEAILIKADKNQKLDKIISHRNGGPDTKFSEKFIKIYPCECFSKSPIAEWLEQIVLPDMNKSTQKKKSLLKVKKVP